MNRRPITPLMHAIIDYAFAGAVFIVPPLIGAKKKNINLYRALGAEVTIYNVLSDHGAGVFPIISFRKHFKIDLGNLTSLAAMGFLKQIRKDKKAGAFHAALLAIGLLNVSLTDWSKR